MCLWLGNVYSIKVNDEGKGHYFIAINEPVINDPVILVNLTDANNLSDKSCYFDKDSELFIYKPSVVAYEFAMLENPESINRKIEQKLIFPINNPYKVKKDTLIKILNGALITYFLEEELEPYILEQVKNTLNSINSYRY